MKNTVFRWRFSNTLLLALLVMQAVQAQEYDILKEPSVSARPTLDLKSIKTSYSAPANDVLAEQEQKKTLQTELQQLAKTLTVSTVNKNWKIGIFGSLTGEMLFADSRPILPTGIVLVSPDFGKDTSTFAAHGKSSSIGAVFIGPEICGLKSGGTILSYFYGEQFLNDQTGFYVVRGFGELKNAFQRISFGLEGDLINPLSPTTLNFNSGNGAGNLGYFRGGLRFERFLHFNELGQLTLQIGLTNPITTAFTGFSDNPPLNILEDNGWPNLELRAAIGLGEKRHHAGRSKRPFEWGVSGLLGQLRRTNIPNNQEIDVAAIGSDLYCQIGPSMGLKAEFFHGQGLGNYNAGIFQIFNAAAQAIQSSGGFAEYSIHWSTSLHSHFGLGIDDPLDSDLNPGAPSRNEFQFANLICDLSKTLEIGLEVSHWETTYSDAPTLPPLLRPGDNSAIVCQTRIRLKF